MSLQSRILQSEKPHFWHRPSSRHVVDLHHLSDGAGGQGQGDQQVLGHQHVLLAQAEVVQGVAAIRGVQVPGGKTRISIS